MKPHAQQRLSVNKLEAAVYLRGSDTNETHWSIVQTPNRETQPEGMGWELFRNYLIAREERRKFLEVQWYEVK